MENRPSHAQLTSNTLYTSQTIHLPDIAISEALKAALCQHSAKSFKKSLAFANARLLSETANSNTSVKVQTQPCVPRSFEKLLH